MGTILKHAHTHIHTQNLLEFEKYTQQCILTTNVELKIIVKNE